MMIGPPGVGKTMLAI
ncbi:MAG: hypothetical protein JSW03_00065 [Candidatus Eiseniibacteriota bacterium]|nr:MAG: hypothetical protein JSW03_00065 [Candidatus Eisenbacteria bacterium]